MRPVRILIVDDHEINLRLAGEVLSDAGYVIQMVGDAEAALAAIEEEMPDLILMDIGLPGMDGLTLTTLLKSQIRTKEIVVVALTAFAMKGDAERAYAAGCDGYITKPFDTRKLTSQVADALNAAQMAHGDRKERTS